MPGGYALALTAVLLASTLRNIAIELPHQLSDETNFLLSSKYFLQWDLVLSLGYKPVPGLAYLRIGSLLANSDHFYLLAKVWNALCLTLTAIPAYLIARRVMPVLEAKAASVLVAVIPPTIYGTYFTPEAVYILAFWVFAAVSVAALNEPRRYATALAAGVLCGIAYLIKPHAVALGAAYVASTVALGLVVRVRSSPESSVHQSWNSRTVTLTHVGSFALGAIATLLVVGKILAGNWYAAFDLKLYSTLVDRATGVGWHSIGSIAWLLVLHAAAIVAALAIPAALVVGFGVRAAKARQSSIVLLVFALAIVSMLLLMTAKATVDFHAIYGGSNTLDRLHGRYYSFALPLLIMVAVGFFREPFPSGAIPPRAKAVAALMTATVVACILVTQRQTFTFLDAPDLTYLIYGQGARLAIIIGTLTAGAIALWTAPSRWLILAGWGLMSLMNVYAIARFQHAQDREQTGDRAVSVIRGLFGAPDLGKGIIVAGSDPVAAARAAFRLASTSPVVPTVPEARARTSRSTRWILVLGDQAGGAFRTPSVHAGDSSVYLLDPSVVVGFFDSQAVNPRYSFRATDAARGVARPAHAPEAWGTWLSGTEAEVVFPHPLPARGTMIVVVSVLDRKLQGPVNLVICEKRFVIPTTDQLMAHRLEYACQSAPDRIRFTGMNPLSPRDIGLSGDPRALALAIEAIEIESAAR